MKQEPALLNIKEFCVYLRIGQTKAREILNNPEYNFTVRIGNRLYANRRKLDEWLDLVVETTRLHDIMKGCRLSAKKGYVNWVRI